MLITYVRTIFYLILLIFICFLRRPPSNYNMIRLLHVQLYMHERPPMKWTCFLFKYHELFIANDRSFFPFVHI